MDRFYLTLAFIAIWVNGYLTHALLSELREGRQKARELKEELDARMRFYDAIDGGING